MNATTFDAAPARVAPVHPTHTFRMLLRREFWEHKGGFLWAPVIATIISLLMTIMGIVLAEIGVRRAAQNGSLDFDGVKVNGLDFGTLMQRMDADDLREMASGIDLFVLLSSTWPFVVLTFVVFFYCLGSLYDERKDRSVLFWKSLPVSDTQTVLSKLTSALLVAPAIAIGVSAITIIVSMVLLSAVVLLHGDNPLTVLWGPASPLTLIGGVVAALPVYALWALPTVGWLMLASAWARSKPFLWAVIVPVFAGIMVSWMGFFMSGSARGIVEAFWKHVVGRLLLGTFPGMDALYRGIEFEVDGLSSFMHLFSAQSTLSSLAMPELWIGAVAGALMIVVAIRLRRWRDEG